MTFLNWSEVFMQFLWTSVNFSSAILSSLKVPLATLKFLFCFCQLSKNKDLGKGINSSFFKIWWDQTRLHGLHPSEVSTSLRILCRWAHICSLSRMSTHKHQICFVVSVERSCDKMELPLWLEQRLKTEWMKQQVILRNEDLQRKYRRVKFTGTYCVFVSLSE